VILIGLGNKARQGKDYVANYMIEGLPDLKRYAFADELKRHCKEHHDEISRHFFRATQRHPMRNPLLWKEDPIYGCVTLLQWYGTYARETDPDVWVKKVADKMQAEKPAAALITDVRFPNEAKFVKQNGGYMIQILRIKDDGLQYLDPNRDPNHPSEIALDNYDYDYYLRVKDGDLASLQFKALGTLQNIIRQEYQLEHGLSVPDSTGHSGEVEVTFNGQWTEASPLG
jgi:hypothetical protein